MRIVHSIGNACQFTLIQRGNQVQVQFMPPADTAAVETPCDTFGIEGDRQSMVALFDTLHSVLANLSEVMKPAS